MSYHVEALCDRRKFGSATRKQIIMYLANKASDDGTGIWCSKHTIARHTELSLATVKRIIREFLVEGMLVATGMRETSIHGQTVIYRIVLERVNQLEPLLREKPQGLTGLMVNPVQVMPATGVTMSPPPGSQRPPNNPKNHPITPPPSRPLAREADEADLEPIWESYPKDRRRDPEACRRELVSALLEASRDELAEAAKTYASETADYTRSKVMLLDNWLGRGRWRQYVRDRRQREVANRQRLLETEEGMLRNAQHWISTGAPNRVRVMQRHADILLERGLVTKEAVKAAGLQC